jgi:hypothetical protein
VSDTILYVTYFVAQQQKTSYSASNGNVRTLFPMSEEDRIVDSQRQAITQFLNSQNRATEIVGSFVEIPENKRTNKWPQLERAIQECHARNATLLIAELGTLTNNETFTQALLESGVSFYCCDQPFVNQIILEALYKHAQVQRKLHGKLIREGLKMTSAKSGNPNAAEVISKVNKPKIDTAIIFAFLLQPIIADYKRKGYSQRQMVKTLNEEGFTAPEGGKWVLSQLQKVLDRVRLNEVAIEAKPAVEEITKHNLTEAEIVEELNRKGITSLKRTLWDENQVKKLLARLAQIKDIELINKFVLDLLPIIHEFRRQNFTITEMVKQFEKAGLFIKQTPVAA